MTIVSEKLKSLSKDVQTIKILGLQSTISGGEKHQYCMVLTEDLRL